MKKIVIFYVCLFLVNQTMAAIPSYYAPQILARANINEGLNLPAMSFLNKSNPMINNRGDIIFKVLALEGQNEHALWVKKLEDINGAINYLAPDERFMTDPSINEAGQIVFNLYDEGVTDGLFVLDSKTSEVEQVVNPDDHPILFYSYPQIKKNGQIYFRATDDADDRSYYRFDEGKINKIMGEGTDNLGHKSAYLFKPSVNDSGMIAFKSRLGEKGQWDERNPDQIILIEPSTDLLSLAPKLTVIAKDKDSDSSSIYKSFGNNISLSKNGMLSFFAYVDKSENNFKKTIIIFKDNLLTQVAIEGENDISEIDFSTLKINEAGTVVFRAKDKKEKFGIYLADSRNVKKIIGEGDEIQTDVGNGRILSNPNYPAFTGEVDMNDQGEIVFNCLVVDADNKELGSAIFKLTPVK